MNRSGNISAAALAFFLSFTLLTTDGQASKTRPTHDLKPAWALPASELAKDANGTFLANLENHHNASSLSESVAMVMQEDLFDPAQNRELRQQYQDMVRDYEYREHYDLIDPNIQRAQMSRMADFSRDVLVRMKKYHLRKTRNQLRHSVERHGVVGPPVRMLGAAAAVYIGEPVKLRLFEDRLSFESRTNFPKNKGSLQLESPVFNGRMDFVGGAPDTRNPLDPPPLDPTLREERYRISLSRAIPLLDVSSGVSYGTTTATVTASVAKQLTDHLACEVDSSKNVKVDSSQLPAQETVKLRYELRF